MMKMISLNYFRFFSAVVLFVSFSLSIAAQTLTPSEIAAFRAQLVEAQSVNTALITKGQCYGSNEASLQAISSQLQETAGELHHQAQKLAAELERAKFKAESFSREFERAVQERQNAENRMRDINFQIRVREAELEDCKRQFGFLGFLCDLAGEISGLKGELRKLTAARQEIDIRIASLENGLQLAHNEKNQAEEQFTQNLMEFDKNKADIASVEEKIKLIKASLSEIRTLQQDNATLRDSFSALLAEFESLDPASEHQSVAHRLRRESEELSALLTKAQKLLDSNGLLLPSGERICAR